MLSSSSTPGQGPLLLLAHGAGAPMDSPVMNALVEALCAEGVEVWRFEFPFMAERRRSGKRRPPDRQPVLLDAWREQVARARQDYPQRPLVLAGKSLGGRMASLLAAEIDCLGWVAFGYPFHPPGKPTVLRTEHLYSNPVPALIVQGSRDKLGNREEVTAYGLPASVALHWLEDGDHDLKPRVRSGLTQQQHLTSAAQAAAIFIQQQAGL